MARSFMCRMRRGRGGVSAMLACGSGAFAPLPWLAVSLTSSSSFKQRSKRVCARRVEKWLLPKSCACHVFPVFGSSYFKKLRDPLHVLRTKKSNSTCFTFRFRIFGLRICSCDTSTRTTRRVPDVYGYVYEYTPRDRQPATPEQERRESTAQTCCVFQVRTWALTGRPRVAQVRASIMRFGCL